MIRSVNNQSANKCNLCGSSNIAEVFKFKGLPLYNLNYFNTQKDALKAEKADVDFVVWKDCGFLFNSIYQQLDYKINYEAGRSYSSVFNQYLSDVVNFVVSNIDANKINNVVELGAGDFYSMTWESVNWVMKDAYHVSWKSRIYIYRNTMFFICNERKLALLFKWAL